MAYNLEKDHRLRKDRLMAQVYAAWVAKDYLAPDQYEGLMLDVNSTNYDGEFANPYSKFTEDDGKSELTRKHLRLVQEMKQREADAARV